MTTLVEEGDLQPRSILATVEFQLPQGGVVDPVGAGPRTIGLYFEGSI